MFEDLRDPSLSMSTGGINMFKSQAADLWPVILKINYLPETIASRQHNILTIALIPGRSQPSELNFLLFLLVKELLRLADVAQAYDRAT